MKKSVFAAVSFAVLVLTGAANAADLAARFYVAPPRPPVWTWTGFYVGLNAGYHWGRDEITATADPPGFIAGAANPAAFDAAYAASLKPQGIIGGPQIGYNWQTTPNVVWGVEADASWLGGSDSRFLTPVAGVAAGDSVPDSTRDDFLATVRGRVGWAIDRSLLYATGGLAVATIKTTDTFNSVGGTVVNTTQNTTTRAGWTVGGGWEYAFPGSNWSAKAEYLFADLGTFDTTIPSTPGFPNSDVAVHHNYTENIARFGLNYRFGGPY